MNIESKQSQPDKQVGFLCDMFGYPKVDIIWKVICFIRFGMRSTTPAILNLDKEAGIDLILKLIP
jgi:hypothetical protein